MPAKCEGPRKIRPAHYESCPSFLSVTIMIIAKVATAANPSRTHMQEAAPRTRQVTAACRLTRLSPRSAWPTATVCTYLAARVCVGVFFPASAELANVDPIQIRRRALHSWRGRCVSPIGGIFHRLPALGILMIERVRATSAKEAVGLVDRRASGGRIIGVQGRRLSHAHRARRFKAARATGHESSLLLGSRLGQAGRAFERPKLPREVHTPFLACQALRSEVICCVSARESTLNPNFLHRKSSPWERAALTVARVRMVRSSITQGSPPQTVTELCVATYAA